ncbi:hypothetical protein [Fumia xinanensis]|uniref:Uncharacterized protein n=1 Tax=Fumia xinanensis TaxID=2763659 RepID=A0A926E3R0_9FIRM|nr:hypothetical protein [Fumia xinanensis]MBC8559569.1 hypothetical protein [Fumia xinanensis]
MRILENSQYVVEIRSGIIESFYDKQDRSGTNLAGDTHLFGSVGFTLLTDDITKQQNKPDFTPYLDRTSIGTVTAENDRLVTCADEENGITVSFSLEKGLIIEASAENPAISQFGINLDLNFLGKQGTFYGNQILPSSPYTSIDRQYTYCLMPRPNGRFLVCIAETACDGFKIDYSPEFCGHYIRNFKFLASFDRAYGGSGRKHIRLNLQCASGLDDAYEIIHSTLGVPICLGVVGGNFAGEPVVKVSDDTDSVEVLSPSKKRRLFPVGKDKTFRLELTEIGLHTVIPYRQGKKGLDAQIWYHHQMAGLFDASCASIRKPYHVDDNLCEGGCFLWAMLVDMRLQRHRKFDGVAREELSQIMGKNGADIPRKTIVPYKTEKFEAFHISHSNRIQEQFFGVSILMEAYKLYQQNEYLEFAVSALMELIQNWITDEGMVFNGEDYTTVCAPVIPIVDMALLLSSMEDPRGEIFRETAIRIAEFLLKRGLSFPTEGTGEDTCSDAEDGSISCTALSVLYVCANLQYDKRYLDFASEVLKLHRAFTIYSPDVRMNRSSFRWWETIWEGDGQGPAICAGHAWTIWKAEALYLYGMLTADEEALMDSWNGFMTNFVKTSEDGTMYSCYEVDDIRGGGEPMIKRTLTQLQGENTDILYKVAHGYPQHADFSLSRYAWVRNAFCWLHTAAILEQDRVLVGMNLRQSDEEWIIGEWIDCLFLGKMDKHIVLRCDHPIRIAGGNRVEVITGSSVNSLIQPIDGKIVISIH